MMQEILLAMASLTILTLGYIVLPRRSPPKAVRPIQPGKVVTILSANAYMIPWFYVYKLVLEGDKFAIGSCKDQHARAKVLADLVKKHDVVAIQEIWGGATDVLQREIEPSHTILPRYRGWGGLGGSGLLADYVNTLASSLRAQGGLWFASCPSTTNVIWSHHHTFVHKEGEEFMDKSVGLVLLDVSHKWGKGHHLLVLNTHLHSPEPFGHTVHRRYQRKEIIKILSAVPDRLKAEEGVTIDWSLCGVILVGDLNTAFCQRGDHTGAQLTKEYLETLKEFDARDLYLENLAYNSVNRGKFSYDGDNNSYVSVASRKDSSRMDYVLALDSICEQTVKLLKLEATHCTIVDNVKEPCSDHWPISVAIQPVVPQ